MNELYFDCSMGAAGDMLSASVLELFDDKDAVLAELNALGIPGVRFAAEASMKCGVKGTHLSVTVHGAEEDEHLHDRGGHHHHAGPREIREIVTALPLPETVRDDVLAVYESIAAAESAVHGVPVTEIHFHELGTMDAVADVTAFCFLLRRLAPGRIAASPVCVGSGQVKCAHGLLPVPAPATALLLRDVPICSGEIRGELCTPTGAALLKYYVNSFGPIPLLRTKKIGYGMGTRDFPAANCVRAFWGESADETGEEMTELRCDLDDMTAEAVAFACERLRAAGAPEVFTVPIVMKKGRPGTMLTVLCRPEQRTEMISLLLRHTATLGVREFPCRRTVLSRRVETVETALGPVRKKISEGSGLRREKWEYEDLARLARERDCSLEEILDLL